MFKKILPLSLCLITITVLAWQSHRVNAGTLPTGNTGSFAGPEAAGEPYPFIRYGANQEFRLDLSDGTETADANGVKWKLGVESAAVAGQPDVKDYRLTWTMITGQSDSTSVGVFFEFNDWSPENFDGSVVFILTNRGKYAKTLTIDINKKMVDIELKAG